MTQLLANVLNVFDRTIKYSELTIQNNRIASINALSGGENPDASYILPGFVDAHVHIESSMLTPAQFARLAVVHGTVATVSDPHEIGNVLGVPGVEYMIADGQRVPFKFCFGAPSCIPATTFESAGATINVQDVRALLEKKEIGYVAFNQIVGVFVVRAEHYFCGIVGQKGNQRVEIFGGTALTDQNIHSVFEFVGGLVDRKTFVVGTHARINILLGGLAAQARCVAVYGLIERLSNGYFGHNVGVSV